MVGSNLVSCGKTGINPLTLALTYPVCTTPTSAGEVSMSWGGGEFIGQNTSDKCANLDDSCFPAGNNVVYFASAGDGPGQIWPSTSPNVVAAGGTTINRNLATFNFEQESAWVFTGDGQSAIEAQPSYQKSAAVQAVCGTAWRCVPDLSSDADPYTGVYVYDTFPIDGFYYYEWLIVGGTSASSPTLAGIINNAATRNASFAASTNAELTKVYASLGTANLTDVTKGFCGFYMGYLTLTGWDFCTGVGVPKGYAGK